MVGTANEPELVAADVCDISDVSRPANTLRYFKAAGAAATSRLHRGTGGR